VEAGVDPERIPEHVVEGGALFEIDPVRVPEVTEEGR